MIQSIQYKTNERVLLSRSHSLQVRIDNDELHWRRAIVFISDSSRPRRDSKTGCFVNSSGWLYEKPVGAKIKYCAPL